MWSLPRGDIVSVMSWFGLSCPSPSLKAGLSPTRAAIEKADARLDRPDLAEPSPSSSGLQLLELLLPPSVTEPVLGAISIPCRQCHTLFTTQIAPTNFNYPDTNQDQLYNIRISNSRLLLNTHSRILFLDWLQIWPK